MTDELKVKIASKMIADYIEFEPENNQGARSLLFAVATVLDFDEEKE